MNPHKRFTREQRKKAKAKHEKFKRRHVFAWRAGRDELIKAIASTKFTPSYQLKVTLIKH